MLGAKYWHNGVGNDGGSFVRTVIILFLHSVHPFLSWILSKVQFREWRLSLLALLNTSKKPRGGL
jgi:hypothetical protein